MPAKKAVPKSSKSKSAARPSRKTAAARRPAKSARASAPARKSVAASAPRKAAPAAKRPLPAARAATPPVGVEEAPPVRPEPVAAVAIHPTASAVSEARMPSAPPAGDADDLEILEPGSLLAGPRNVQPYIPKRGEQYMSKEQLDHFRAILGSWKRDLMVEVDRTVSHMKDEAANFPDPNDRATQEEEFSLELRTRDRERKLIRKIDDALKRIEDGSYGYCLETGEEIGIKRLEARPVATLSIEAQERRERREKQYGDRDDRYR
jgi:DnaK suppressor protein